MKRFTSLAAAAFTAAFLAAATSVSAQDANVDQRTYLTFSGPVQMPGVNAAWWQVRLQARSDGASQRHAGLRC
jgi:ABC-type sugar transport system substrate-binding protein